MTMLYRMISPTSLNPNRSTHCIKYSLVLFNLIFVITGVMVIIVGTTINSVYNDFSQFLEARYFSPAALLVAIGFIIFGISCLGFFGAMRESTCMIMTFSFFLQVVFILEMAAGISGYFLIKHVRGFLAHSIKNAIQEYPLNNSTALAVDFLQSELKCCGGDSFNDWHGVLNNSTSNDTALPSSCCAKRTEDKCNAIFLDGCVFQLEDIIKESGLLLAVTAISIACLQFVGVVFSCSLARTLRIQKTKREQRKWMVRDQLLSNADPYYNMAKKYPTGEPQMAKS